MSKKKEKPGFVNLAQLRERIRKYAERAARDAGLDNPYATVRIADPQQSGKRGINVEVSHDLRTGSHDEAN